MVYPLSGFWFLSNLTSMQKYRSEGGQSPGAPFRSRTGATVRQSLPNRPSLPPSPTVAPATGGDCWSNRDLLRSVRSRTIHFMGPSCKSRGFVTLIPAGEALPQPEYETQYSTGSDIQAGLFEASSLHGASPSSNYMGSSHHSDCVNANSSLKLQSCRAKPMCHGWF